MINFVWFNKGKVVVVVIGRDSFVVNDYSLNDWVGVIFVCDSRLVNIVGRIINLVLMVVFDVK